MNENTSSTMSFDRMRNMLTRAAEIRESEQQQIFDALDEIHARMSPLESLGSVRKRLSELPDRTEVSVLAERLDEALSKLESQDSAISGLERALEGMLDKLAKPFAQLDGRLDGVGGRFEGVAGRMDGLEDKLAHIHKRLDDLDLHLERQDTKTDQLPSAVHGPLRERLEALETALRSRIDEIDMGVHDHLDSAREALQRSSLDISEDLKTSFSAGLSGLSSELAGTRNALAAKLDAVLARPAVDPTDRLEALAQRLEQVTSRLDDMAAQTDAAKLDVTATIGDFASSVRESFDEVGHTLAARPDSDRLLSLVRNANDEAVRENATHLDEAMATFAQLILGAPQPSTPQPTALPRAQRRTRSPKPALAKADELEAEGA